MPNERIECCDASPCGVAPRAFASSSQSFPEYAARSAEGVLAAPATTSPTAAKTPAVGSTTPATTPAARPAAAPATPARRLSACARAHTNGVGKSCHGQPPVILLQSLAARGIAGFACAAILKKHSVFTRQPSI
eukprot:6201899-Pleurochrysis_carterae.AAC.4